MSGKPQDNEKRTTKCPGCKTSLEKHEWGFLSKFCEGFEKSASPRKLNKVYIEVKHELETESEDLEMRELQRELMELEEKEKELIKKRQKEDLRKQIAAKTELIEGLPKQ